MNAPFLIVSILTLSIIIQTTAAIMAFRLIRVTGRRAAWILIAVALTLMAVRRVVPLYHLLAGDAAHPPDPLNEIIGLVLSVTMATGIAFIAPIFTEWKRVQDSLRESEEKFRTLFEESFDGILLTSPGGKILDVNRQGIALLGYDTKEEILNLDLERDVYVHPSDRKQMLASVNARGAAESDVAFKKKRGEQMLAHLALVALKDKRGVITSYRCTIRDITERKRIEQALKASEERFRRLAERARDVIYRMSLPDGIYEYVSPAVTEFCGYTPEEFYSSPQLLRKVLHPDWLGYFEEQWSRLLRGDMPPTYEYQIIHKSGDVRWVNQRNILVRDDGGRVVAIEGIVTDITERKRAEETARELNTKLEHRVRERTWQLEETHNELVSFSYSMSHDLRTPLRSINGFSSLLLADYADKLDEQGREHLRTIRAASQKMALLIDDLVRLLQINRSQMRLEEVNLSRIAGQVADELKKSESDRDAEFVIAPDCVVWGDAALLRIATENVLGNAWKYTSKKPHARIEFGAIESADGPAFFVRDNGCGFDMKYVHKLFGAFQRLHSPSEFPGSGIGLASVQRVIRRHGGKVWIEGKVDEGTVLYFTLPGKS